jgi:acetylglutamate kinase
MTDVEGIKDKDGALISTLQVPQAKKLIASGVISEGMIPKVECCIDALRAGVAKTHIIDGRLVHSVLLEIFTSSGIGTEVVQAESRARDSGRSGARRQAQLKA